MDNSNAAGPEPKKAGLFKKAFGTFCHHCPVCSFGRKHHDSLIGKALHHPLHADNCPAWKAEKELYPAG
jgi:hypothetical protein